MTTPSFSCQATAAFLDAGRTLAGASHAAALLSGVACLFPAPAFPSRLCAVAALLLWLPVCYLLLRVAIDAPLFRNPSDFEQLDGFLVQYGLRRSQPPKRPVEDRIRGALALFRYLTVAIVLQISVTIAALLARWN
jgi:hypothetical protein